MAVAATVNDPLPFYFAQTETYIPTPCTRSCTITLPVLPAHVAYYQVRFYDSEGTLVALGDHSVALEGIAVKSNGAPAAPNR